MATLFAQAIRQAIDPQVEFVKIPSARALIVAAPYCEYPQRGYSVTGKVWGNPAFEDGSTITTSTVRRYTLSAECVNLWEVHTLNSVYLVYYL